MKTIAVFCVLLATIIAGPVKDLDCQPKIEGRIFGGLPAAPHQFPYQVGLLLRAESNDITLCGGSLISKTVVLTAAHCLVGVLDGKVQLGAKSLRLPNKGKVIQNVTNKDFIIHPDYIPVGKANDIALVRLPNKVVFNEYVQTISLPRPDQGQNVLEGKIALISGWGRIGEKKRFSCDDLLYINVRILSDEPCRKAYQTKLLPTQICVSGNHNKSVCSGDSGGPLVVSDAVVGVVSKGHKNGCESGEPTISTRVTSYLDWIAKNSGVVPN